MHSCSFLHSFNISVLLSACPPHVFTYHPIHFERCLYLCPRKHAECWGGGWEKAWVPPSWVLNSERAEDKDLHNILRTVLTRHLIPQILIGDKGNDGDKYNTVEKGFSDQRPGAGGAPGFLGSANHQQEPEAKLQVFSGRFKEGHEGNVREALEERIHSYKKDLAYELSSL